MYKTNLQEVCQQRLWTNPNYTYSKDGPDHKPQFKASVIINGVSFHSPHFCKSSKEAKNEAARIAFHHFITSPTITNSPVSTDSSSASNVLRNGSSSEGTLLQNNEEISNKSLIHGNASIVKDGQDIRDVHYLYKSQLQNYAQKRSLVLPVYSCVREGSPHALRFKAMVTVDGQTFESLDFFRTLKEAEHAAAKAAFFSLSKDGILEDDCGLHKNLLQELTAKEGFSIPVFTTIKSGASHVPLFTSSVEVEGDVFHGGAAKTKKQSEINAAKVAFLSLKERLLSRTSAPVSQSINVQKALDSINCSTLSSTTTDLQQKLNLEDICVYTHTHTQPLVMLHVVAAFKCFRIYTQGLLFDGSTMWITHSVARTTLQNRRYLGFLLKYIKTKITSSVLRG